MTQSRTGDKWTHNRQMLAGLVDCVDVLLMWMMF